MADIGLGAIIYRSSDGTFTGSFANVGELYDFTPPSVSRAVVDITKHSAPDGWRQFKGGVRTPGDMTLQVVLDPASGGDVYDWQADINAATPGAYRIRYRGIAGADWDFAGYVVDVQAQTPIDDKRSLAVTIRLDGKPRFVTFEPPPVVTAQDVYPASGVIVGASIQVVGATPMMASFNVYRYTANAFALATLVGDFTAVDQFLIDEVAAGTYYYWVTAVDGAGNESAPTQASPAPLTVTDS